MSISIKANIGEIYGITVDFIIRRGSYDISATSVNGKTLPKPVPLLSRNMPVEWDVEEKFQYYMGNISVSDDSDNSTRITISGSSGDHHIVLTKRDDMCIIIDCREHGFGSHWIVSPFKHDNTIVIMCSHIDETDHYDFTQTIKYGDNGYVKSDIRKY